VLPTVEIRTEGSAKCRKGSISRSSVVPGQGTVKFFLEQFKELTSVFCKFLWPPSLIAGSSSVAMGHEEN